MKKRKINEKIPQMPDNKFELLFWFMTYHTNKFVGILVIILIVILLMTTLNITCDRDNKGKMKLKEIKIDSVDVNLGNKKKNKK